MDSWNSFLLLAQDNAPEAAEQAPQAPSPFGWVIMFLPIIVLWFVLIILPQNKERAKRQEMLSAIKKNDPVITKGGMLGTVSHISEDGNEVTVKVDDNTRIKFLRDAIQGVVRGDSADGK